MRPAPLRPHEGAQCQQRQDEGGPHRRSTKPQHASLDGAIDQRAHGQHGHRPQGHRVPKPQRVWIGLAAQRHGGRHHRHRTDALRQTRRNQRGLRAVPFFWWQGIPHPTYQGCLAGPTVNSLIVVSSG